MNQQHTTGQTCRRGHFLLEVEQDVARVRRIVVLHLVAEHELVLEVHQAERAVRLWRGLGYQASHATTAITGDVVPDDFNAAFRDRERNGGFKVLQAVAAGHQLGVGGVLLDGGEHLIRHGGTAVGRIDRHLEGFRVALEHRVLARGKLFLVLVDVLRRDGEQRFFTRVRIGQEALAVDRSGILRQRFPGRDRTVGVTRHFGAHRGQALAQLVGLGLGNRCDDAGRQQRKPQNTGVEQTLGYFHMCVRPENTVLRSSRRG
ncbi:hypothetical protein D3C76_737790 [compost metagenome]